MNLGNMVGMGNTANVYEWEDGKVLKLFHQGYPDEAILKEYHNAMAIKDMTFAKPKVYEMIIYEDKKGILYDKVEGIALTDWIMNTGDIEKGALYMAELHKEILQNSISGIPSYKDFLRNLIPASLTKDKQEELLQLIDKLADTDVLCHGDFHPGNILILEENTCVIDFMNLCHGSILYDIARTVYLVEYTPVPLEVKDKEMLINLKRKLIDLYLEHMDVTRDMIQDYLSVIMLVRKWECPI